MSGTVSEYPGDGVFMEWASRKLKEGKLVALITIVRKSGSAPRGPGTKMLVSEDGETIGTIGGGDAERKIIGEALKAIKERRNKLLKIAMFRESLFEDVITTGNLCGGVIEVFVDVLKPEQRLIIIGAGHVARPLARIGKMLGYRVIVIDNFPEYATKERIPDADEIYAEKDILKAMDAVRVTHNDFVVVVHGDGDLEASVLEKIFLDGNIPRYLGLLSGKGKLAYILRKLLKKGVDPGVIEENLYSPAGLAIGSETPEEIALAIMSEILSVDRGLKSIHENKTPQIIRTVIERMREDGGG